MLSNDLKLDNSCLIYINNLLTEADCRQLIASTKTKSWHDSNFGSRKIQHCDYDRHEIIHRIRDQIPSQISDWKFYGIHPSTFQIFRYEKGDDFPFHQDREVVVNPTLKSFYTLVIYLNDCIGGETEFREPVQVVKPKLGAAVIFPQELVHRSRVIAKHNKFILRGQLLYEKS